jgi:hypothetical protein
MITIKLNMNLLQVIGLVQSKKQNALYESELGLCSDWVKSTKDYFFALPDNLVTELGLKRNEACFHAISKFDITEEIEYTFSSDLHLYKLNY